MLLPVYPKCPQHNFHLDHGKYFPKLIMGNDVLNTRPVKYLILGLFIIAVTTAILLRHLWH